MRSVHDVKIAVSLDKYAPDTLLSLPAPPTSCTAAQRAYLLHTRTYALRRLARHTEALVHADSLLRCCTAMLSAENLATARIYRANSLYYTERYPAALDAYTEALAEYRRHNYPWPELLLEMRVNRAWALYHTGNGPAAYCEAQEAARLYAIVGDFPRRRELMGEALKLLPLAFEHGGSPEYCQGTAKARVNYRTAGLLLCLLIGAAWWGWRYFHAHR